MHSRPFASCHLRRMLCWQHSRTTKRSFRRVLGGRRAPDVTPRHRGQTMSSQHPHGTFEQATSFTCRQLAYFCRHRTSRERQFLRVLTGARCGTSRCPPLISVSDGAVLTRTVWVHCLINIDDAGVSGTREPAPVTGSITQRFPIFAHPRNTRGIRRLGETWRPSFQVYASSSSSAVPCLRNRRLGTFKCRALALAVRQVSLLLEQRPRESTFPLGNPSINRALLRVYKRCKAIIMRLQPALFANQSGLHIFRAVWKFVEASGFVATLVAAEAEDKAGAPLSAELLLVRVLNAATTPATVRRR